jgi:thiol-disulfide isomerase/thioredoxin
MKTLLAFLILYAAVLQASDVFDQADQLVSQKKPDQAVQLLRDYDKTHPNDVTVHESIQRILKKEGKQEQALSEYKQRYEKDSNGLNSYLYARLLSSPSEQEKIYRTTIEKHPDSVWGHFGLATSLLDQDRLQEGIDAAEAGLKTVKEPARLHYVMARIYRRMKDYPNAAAQARENYKLDPTDDNRDIAFAYEWFEVEHTDNLDTKYSLAQAWFKKFKHEVMNTKSESIDDISRLAELTFVYVEKDGKLEELRTVLEVAQQSLKNFKPTDNEERAYYGRLKAALLAVQAWSEAKEKENIEALEHAGQAVENALGSEGFYFGALAYLLLHRNQEALDAALRADSYPPVYPRAKQLATDLWKTVHGSMDGFDEALKKQRDEFTPARKKMVLAEMVNESYQPFHISDPNGKQITDKELKGKIVLMNFWAVWCPPCREELPHWNQFYAEHKNDPGLMLFAVGDEPWETIQNYMKNQKYDFAVYRNEDYWKQFNVEGIPTLVVIDPAGKIRFRNTGFEEGMDYAQTLQWQIEAIK